MCARSTNDAKRKPTNDRPQFQTKQLGGEREGKTRRKETGEKKKGGTTIKPFDCMINFVEVYTLDNELRMKRDEKLCIINCGTFLSVTNWRCRCHPGHSF